eukprot:247720_1
MNSELDALNIDSCDESIHLPSHPRRLSRQLSSLDTLSSERKTKASFTIIIILCMIILICVNKSSTTNSKYHMFAYLLIILVLFWNTIFFSIILTSNQLHMIYIKRKQVNYSRFLFVPYDYVEDPHRVLLSVSAVNAIVGSNAERSALLTMYGTFCVGYCAVSTKWSEQKTTDFTSLDIQLTLMLISCIGLLMVATWQVEPHIFSYCMHYISAIMTVISSPAAFMLQQQFSSFSILVTAMTYCGLIEWIIMYTFMPFKHDDLDKVHKYSLICITNEALVLMMAYACGIMFIYNL